MKRKENKKKNLFPKRTNPTLIFALVCLLAFAGMSFGVGNFFRVIRKSETNALVLAFTDPSARPVVIVLGVVVLAMLFKRLFENRRQNKVAAVDERGINYMEASTYGSSRWMKKEEIEKSYTVCSINDTDTILYGQLTEEGKQVVGYKPSRTAAGTRSSVLIASSGSGKSFTYIRNSVIQCVRRGNTSFVVTDPSGELYSDLSAFCRDQGMEVHLLNLADPNYSEFWDFLEETINPQTGRIDSRRLNEFATIFMENSPNVEKDFWYKSALNLLKTVLAYTAYRYEESVLIKYRQLYSQICPNDETGFIKRSKETFISFAQCQREIIQAAKENHQDVITVARLLKEIEMNPSYPYTIAKVYENLLHFSEIEKSLKEIPSFHPAHISYLVFATNDTDNVRKSALQGTQLCFDLFSDEMIREMLSHKGMHISDINLKRTATFVIVSDKSTTTKPIASLFFSFLLKDAQDTYDRKEQFAKESGTKNPCLELDMILDEFYSIGVIQGNPEAAGVSFSNARKRGICFYLAIQSYSQIEALYGKYIKDIILGNCSTLLYMGSNDEATCRYISEYASGNTTILTETHSERGLFHVSDNETTIRSDHRFLLTVDEARRWKDKVLVVKQGELPCQLNPLPWTDQPCYKNGQIRKVSIYSTVVPLSRRLAEEAKHTIADPDTYFKDSIDALGNSAENDFVSSNDLRGNVITKPFDGIDF